MGMRKLVVEAMKRTEPIQSTRRNFKPMLVVLKASLRVRGTATKAMPMKGSLR